MAHELSSCSCYSTFLLLVRSCGDEIAFFISQLVHDRTGFTKPECDNRQYLHGLAIDIVGQ